MKSVTIENVKARIAELEGADQLIGLGLHAEFELACLRQLAASMDGKPFMYGIADPDGAAHMDEFCVSTSIAGIEDAVNALNEECEEGGPLFTVVSLFRHHQPAPERDRVRADHASWSQDTFGNVGPIGPLKHLAKEAMEAAAAPNDLSEWADMQFLLWDAQRRAGITDEQITQAMIEKLAVNKARQWPEPKDGEPRLHVKPATDNTAQQFEALATSQAQKSTLSQAITDVIDERQHKVTLEGLLHLNGDAYDEIGDLSQSLGASAELCVRCGRVSSHPEGWHYCHATSELRKAE